MTIKDIAKAMGVSTATVSKALNGYSDINAETAAKIRAFAKEANYHPNIAARQLKTNSSHNIGVLFVDDTDSGLTHEFFAAILNAAKNEFEKLGYDITFINHSIGGTEATFLEHAKYRRCDGVLIASIDFKNKEVIELVNSEIPTVTIGYPYTGKSCVLSDDIEGFYKLTKYVIEMGHRRIAIIHGEDTDVTRKRLTGFYRALKEYDIDFLPGYKVEAAYHDTEGSAAATRKLMDLPDPPTIIMYPDDFAYLGGMAELEKMNLRVPEDISVTGYDGINLSQCLRPQLTTYQQNSEEIGRRSARKLIEHIENCKEAVAEQIRVDGRLIIGKSVADIN